jgi:hypothetical protein
VRLICAVFAHPLCLVFPALLQITRLAVFSIIENAPTSVNFFDPAPVVVFGTAVDVGRKKRLQRGFTFWQLHTRTSG